MDAETVDHCTCYQLVNSNEPDAIQECVYCMIRRVFDPAYVSVKVKEIVEKTGPKIVRSGKRVSSQVSPDQGTLGIEKSP